MKPLLILFLLFRCLLGFLENSLISEPQIKCTADTIEMHFRTKHRFTGRIYVQGHHDNPDCRMDYSQLDSDGAPTGAIRLRHGACDMDRQRLVRSGTIGMQFSAILVISFHPIFNTKVDRAFHVNCLYREVMQPVKAEMSVSDVPTAIITHDVPLPTCEYTIRKDELDGPILRVANVGDQVVHRWECNSKDHGMLVHNCYVEDGQGEKRMVIDERGCHTDMVLGDPTYVQDLNMSYRESNVFKFADTMGVRFLCEIKLCLKLDGGCAGITPPDCLNPQSPNFQDDEWQLDGNETIEGSDDIKFLSKRSVRESRTDSTDLISQYVYVLDTSDEPPASSLKEKSPLESRFCLSSATFASLLILMVLVFSMSTVLFLGIYIRRIRMAETPLKSF